MTGERTPRLPGDGTPDSLAKRSTGYDAAQERIAERHRLEVGEVPEESITPEAKLVPVRVVIVRAQRDGLCVTTLRLGTPSATSQLPLKYPTETRGGLPTAGSQTCD